MWLFKEKIDDFVVTKKKVNDMKKIFIIGSALLCLGREAKETLAMTTEAGPFLEFDSALPLYYGETFSVKNDEEKDSINDDFLQEDLKNQPFYGPEIETYIDSALNNSNPLSARRALEKLLLDPQTFNSLNDQTRKKVLLGIAQSAYPSPPNASNDYLQYFELLHSHKKISSTLLEKDLMEVLYYKSIFYDIHNANEELVSTYKEMLASSYSASMWSISLHKKMFLKVIQHEYVHGKHAEMNYFLNMLMNTSNVANTMTSYESYALEIMRLLVDVYCNSDSKIAFQNLIEWYNCQKTFQKLPSQLRGDVMCHLIYHYTNNGDFAKAKYFLQEFLADKKAFRTASTLKRAYAEFTEGYLEKKDTDSALLAWTKLHNNKKLFKALDADKRSYVLMSIASFFNEAPRIKILQELYSDTEAFKTLPLDVQRETLLWMGKYEIETQKEVNAENKWLALHKNTPLFQQLSSLQRKDLLHKVGTVALEHNNAKKTFKFWTELHKDQAAFEKLLPSQQNVIITFCAEHNYSCKNFSEATRLFNLLYKNTEDFNKLAASLRGTIHLSIIHKDLFAINSYTNAMRLFKDKLAFDTLSAFDKVSVMTCIASRHLHNNNSPRMRKACKFLYKSEENIKELLTFRKKRLREAALLLHKCGNTEMSQKLLDKIFLEECHTDYIFPDTLYAIALIFHQCENNDRAMTVLQKICDNYWLNDKKPLTYEIAILLYKCGDRYLYMSLLEGLYKFHVPQDNSYRLRIPHDWHKNMFDLLDKGSDDENESIPFSNYSYRKELDLLLNGNKENEFELPLKDPMLNSHILQEEVPVVLPQAYIAQDDDGENKFDLLLDDSKENELDLLLGDNSKNEFIPFSKDNSKNELDLLLDDNKENASEFFLEAPDEDMPEVSVALPNAYFAKDDDEVSVASPSEQSSQSEASLAKFFDNYDFENTRHHDSVMFLLAESFWLWQKYDVAVDIYNKLYTSSRSHLKALDLPLANKKEIAHKLAYYYKDVAPDTPKVLQLYQDLKAAGCCLSAEQQEFIAKTKQSKVVDQMASAACSRVLGIFSDSDSDSDYGVHMDTDTDNSSDEERLAIISPLFNKKIKRNRSLGHNIGSPSKNSKTKRAKYDDLDDIGDPFENS